MRASYVHVSNRHQIEELRGPVAGEDHEVDIVSTGMRVRPGRDTKGPSPVVESDDDGHSVAQASWRKDKWGIALLLVLYTLQGIPMGLSNAVPFMLMERGASYSDQAKFSLVSWPYATKLLWAPLVDSLSHRRHWVVASQLLVGASMIAISTVVEVLLEDVTLLTAVFLVLYFFVATQDIAVDGWALTILSRENVGYASTCNTVGQYLGFSISYVVFLALNSEEFCNTYIRDSDSVGGLVTLPGFLYGWGFVFLVVTTALPFVHNHTHCSGGRSEGGDNPPAAEAEGTAAERDGAWARVTAAYRSMWAIIRLPSVLTLGALLLTSRIGLATDALLGLKLVEKGVPKDKLALLGTFLLPLEIAMPVVVSKLIVGDRPLRLYRLGLPARLLLAIPYLFLVISLPDLGAGGDGVPTWLYVGFLLISMPYRACANAMFVSQMAFFARVSDPRVGGTYMTLLNTLANLGGQWPAAVTLRVMGALTTKTCEAGDQDATLESLSAASLCHDEASSARCTESGGHCRTVQDGFVPIVVTSLALGTLWVVATWRTIDDLQQRPLHRWRCADAESLEDGGDEEMSLLTEADQDGPSARPNALDPADDVSRRRHTVQGARNRVTR